MHSEVTKMDIVLRSESVDFDWLEGFGVELEDRGWLVKSELKDQGRWILQENLECSEVSEQGHFVVEELGRFHQRKAEKRVQV